MNRPALRDPVAEIAMCLNAASAALHAESLRDPALIPFLRLQLLRAGLALDQLAARTPSPGLKLVADGGDLGRAAGHLESPASRSPVAGGSCEVPR